jgi:hypothetical protein
MQKLLDPKGFSEAARGVNPEVVAETGHNLPADAELDPTLSEETVGEELGRLEKALSQAYIKSSAATESAGEESDLTPVQEGRLERLLEIHNRTEAFRIMGLNRPGTARK